jgi:hypothetical protein
MERHTVPGRIPSLHRQPPRHHIRNAVLGEAMGTMWLGPAIAGASWYGIFFAFVLDLYHFSYPVLMTWYAVLIIFFIIFLRILRELMMKK